MMDYSKATCNFPNNHLSCNMSTSENLHSETKSEETSLLSNFLKKKETRKEAKHMHIAQAWREAEAGRSSPWRLYISCAYRRSMRTVSEAMLVVLTALL
jgi:hypothetical protein